MHRFVRNLITEWRRLQLPVENASVVVAVSGGADSVSLLLGLNELRKASKLNLKIVAAHLNHQLRGVESDVDEQFVKHLTTELGISLDLRREKIASDGNLEQNARVARYRFLTEAATNVGAFAILTGHTINDQAETFLLNLIRGSGPDGLSGMRVIRSVEEEKRRRGDEEVKDLKRVSPLLPFSSSPLLLIRPLLSWAKRIDTEAFCNELDIEYRYDTMNDDTAFKRVQIRKILLPLLADMNPNIIETLANTAFLMQSVSEHSPSCGGGPPTSPELSVSELKALSGGGLYDILRSWLRDRRGTTRSLELKHIQAIERLVFSEKSGKTVEIPGGKVVKSGGRLCYREN